MLKTDLKKLICSQNFIFLIKYFSIPDHTLSVDLKHNVSFFMCSSTNFMKLISEDGNRERERKSTKAVKSSLSL